MTNKNLHLLFGKTLYRLADKAGEAKAVHEQLTTLSSAFASKELLAQAKACHAAEEKALSHFFSSEAKFLPLVSNLAVLLWKSRILNLLPKILEVYTKEYFTAQKISKVMVVTAREFTPPESTRILELLRSAFSGEISVSTRVSHELIGGVRIYHDGKLTDLSVRGALDRLSHALSYQS